MMRWTEVFDKRDHFEFASARNVIQTLGGKWHGSYGTARCPAHEDKHPSLSVSERDGKVLVKCHGPCDQEAVLEALRDCGLWGGSDETGRRREFVKPRSTANEVDANANCEFALAIWNAAGPPEKTLVEIYLGARGVTTKIPRSIRYHPSLRHAPTGLDLPAMVAAVQGSDRTITGIHRTFLTMEGTKKAPVSQNKMMLGRCAGGAVRLAAVDDHLALAEGIETALSVQQATGFPTWAMLSTGGLKSVVLPGDVREVVICADGDEAGERAANNLAQRLLREDREVQIAHAPNGMDFNDVLVLPKSSVPRDARTKESANG